MHEHGIKDTVPIQEQEVGSDTYFDAISQAVEGIPGLSDLATGLGSAEEFSPLLPAASCPSTFASDATDEIDWDQFVFALDGQPIGSTSSSNSLFRRMSSANGINRKERLERLKLRIQQLWSPQRILLRDKLAFLLGSCLVWANAYWLGWSAATFYRFYTAQVAVLMALRYAWYRHKKWHYYLLDFCYFANILLLVHLWLLPNNLLLSKVTFAYNTGPLTWSTIAFRNSLVYHDIDKVTSVFLHLVPACVTWTLRWHPPPVFEPPDDAPEVQKTAWHSASLSQLVLLPLAPYLLWAVSYYLKIFVVSAERIKQRGYITLFTYVTTTTKGVYAAIARRVPKQYRPQVYLFLHMCFCGTTFLVSWVCWHHFQVHTLLLAVMGAVSVWHGATWYFDVFAKRYLAELSKQLAQAAAAADAVDTLSKVDPRSSTKAAAYKGGTLESANGAEIAAQSTGHWKDKSI